MFDLPGRVGLSRLIAFDLDGVLAPTAVLHRQAWVETFNRYFAEEAIGPAFTDAEYFEHLDGRPRFDGVKAVLVARGLNLPWGRAEDDPAERTICGIGNRKSAAFEVALAAGSLESYPQTDKVLATLRPGRALAVVSSSQYARPVLERCGLLDWFDLVVDGAVAVREQLPGKPAPDTFVWAARQLGVAVADAVVVEDAVAGVAAGRAGQFGLVVGVDRGAGADALIQAGADAVVSSLEGLIEPGVG